MIRRRQLLTASAAVLAAPAIIERANAQSAFDWKQAKGSKLEVNFGKHPSADVLQAKQKEFEELTGIKVGSEQIPEQQQRPKVAMELSTGRPSFDVVIDLAACAEAAHREGQVDGGSPPISARCRQDQPRFRLRRFLRRCTPLRDGRGRHLAHAAEPAGFLDGLLEQGAVRRKGPRLPQDHGRDAGDRPQAQRSRQGRLWLRRPRPKERQRASVHPNSARHGQGDTVAPTARHC